MLNAGERKIRAGLTLAGRAVLARESNPTAEVWRNAPPHRENPKGFAQWVNQNAEAVERFLAG